VTRRDERGDRHVGSRSTSFDALRTERWIALIRLAVIGVVIAIYLGSGVGRQTPGPLVLAILGLAFWRAGIPALQLTDTADFRNPHYHAPTDTPDTLDYTFLSKVVRATALAVIHLAGFQEP